MTIDEVKAILKDYIEGSNLVYHGNSPYINYWSGPGNTATLDGDFTADELEAISVWMRTYDSE